MYVRGKKTHQQTGPGPPRIRPSRRFSWPPPPRCPPFVGKGWDPGADGSYRWFVGGFSPTRFEKICVSYVQLDHFPRGENEEYLKPPPIAIHEVKFDPYKWPNI